MSSTERRRKPAQPRSRAMVEAILEATAQILVEEGYDHASTNRVAKRAGVSVGSLYQYFSGKEALVEALAERHLQTLLTIATRPLLGAPDLGIPELTRRVVEGLVAAHQAEPALHRVLTEQAPVDVVQRFRRAAEQALAADMERRRAHGENRIDDPEIAAFVIVTMIDEAIRSAVLRRPHLLEGGRLVDALTDLTLRYVLAERGEPPTAAREART